MLASNRKLFSIRYYRSRNGIGSNRPAYFRYLREAGPPGAVILQGFGRGTSMKDLWRVCLLLCLGGGATIAFPSARLLELYPPEIRLSSGGVPVAFGLSGAP